MKPITILGGGLAGLTLGIQLRQKNVPVTLHEAGTYPRHRVCGEYLSGRALSVVESLGLRPALHRLGAVEASDILLALGSSVLHRRTLPQPALCLSRYEFDQFLVQEFTRLGGVIHLGQRVTPEAKEGTVFGYRPPTLHHRKRLALVWAQSPCPKCHPASRPRNASLPPRLHWALPNRKSASQCLRPFSLPHLHSQFSHLLEKLAYS